MNYRTLFRGLFLAGGILAWMPSGVAQNSNLQLSSSRLAFNGVANGPQLPTQAITVTSIDGSSVAFALLVDSGSTGTAAPSWVTVTPTQATTPAQIRVTVNPSGLATGPYSARVQLTDRQGRPLGIIIPVNVQLSSGTSEFDVEPSEVTLSSSVAAGNVRQGMLVQSLGSAPVSPVTVSVTAGYPWLSAAVPTCTTICPVNINVAVSSLSPGAHTGLLHVTTALGSKDVPVSVYAADHGPFDQLSTSAVFFEAIQTSGLMDSRGVSLLNNGDSASTWSLDIPDGASWLSVSPTSGVIVPSQSASLTVSMNLGNQAPGTYSSMVRISSQDPGFLTLYLPVILRVDVSGTTATPILSTGGAVLSSQSGALDAVQQQVTLSAASATPITYEASPQGSNWLSLIPLRGQASSSPTPLAISAAAMNEGQGFYSGLINVGFGVSSVRTMHVGFAVTGVTGVACQPQLSYLTETAIPDNFALHSGAPTPLEVVFVDDCGNPITNGTVTASFSNGDPAIEMISTGNGHYVQTWTPLNPSASLPNGNLSAAFQGFASGLSPALTEVIGSVTMDSLPAIATGGVLNNLSPQIGAPVAPGTVVQLYGSSLATGAGSATIINGQLSTTIGGVSVLVGGLNAPLFYTSSGQIDLQIPSELQPNQQYQVIVDNNGVRSKPESINTTAVQPGLASFPDGTVIAQDINYQLINAQNPAHAGDVITLYLTGMGATTPAVPTGMVSPATPLAVTTVQPQVTIDGVAGEVSFSGLTPGAVGLYQINVRIPAGARTGDLPLVVSQNGVMSNTAMVPVG
jgi:uncharacterized protein (TIGR03437 family)